MRGSTHEALALGASFGYCEWQGVPTDPRALPLAALCLAALGSWEAVATSRQKRQLKNLGAWKQEMQQRNLSPAHIEALKAQGHAPSVYWKGPPRKASGPLRMLALICALTAAPLIAIALAAARLPDLLEVGKIPHRGPTHWLLTAGVLTYGLWCVLDYKTIPTDTSALVMTGFAIGWGSHLVSDGWTLSGVPYLWPIVRRDLHLLPEMLRIRTGSLVDTAIAFGTLAALVLASAPPA
jgi:membrane-bound metal-dependent hydrolase YbcI (DUF457 family)